MKPERHYSDFIITQQKKGPNITPFWGNLTLKAESFSRVSSVSFYVWDFNMKDKPLTLGNISWKSSVESTTIKMFNVRVTVMS